MATHSSVLAWRIPGTGKPGGLPSMGSHGVRLIWDDGIKSFWQSVGPSSALEIPVLLHDFIAPWGHFSWV